MQDTYNFIPTSVNRRTLKVLFQMTRAIVVVAPPLEVTSFEMPTPEQRS
jgi:hypothetical protein